MNNTRLLRRLEFGITEVRGGMAYPNQTPSDKQMPHRKTPINAFARKRFGRISIANSDAGALAMVESAVDQPHRAVKELLGLQKV